MSKKGKGGLRGALMGTKARHAPPLPMAPLTVVHPPAKMAGMKLKSGKAIPGHGTGGGTMGCM